MQKIILFNCYLIASLLIFSDCQQQTKEVNETSEVATAQASNTPLIKGTFFEGANGIYFDDKDQLHVASVTSRLIGVVNTETGAIIKTYGPEEGIEGPDDLIFGPDGSLYHTSILTGEVGKRTPTGEVTRQFVAPGTNPITFSDDGRLFVALDFQGDGLYELDPNLVNPPKLIIKELGWLNGMDFGPDGFLYGPIWSKGHIVKIDVNTGELEVLIDDLVTPAAVKFDSKGNLFTADHYTGIVYQIDLTNNTKKEIAKGFEGVDNIAFNSKDELFLSHAQDGSISQINMDGTSRTIIAPSMTNAADVEVVDGQLWTPDVMSLRTFDKNTGQQTAISRHMIGRPGVISPFTIDREGDHMVMTSWFGNEVQVWNYKTGSQKVDYRDFIVPLNAIFDNGDLIVAELGMEPGAAKVSRQKGDTREVLIDGSKGLIIPSGIVAKEGNIYVADFYKGVVFQVTEANQVLKTPKVVASDLKQPEGLQIGPKGNLLIVETGANQVSRLDLSTGKKSVLVDNIPLGKPAAANMPPTWKMSDIAYDAEGNLFVPSDIENVVYRFSNVF